MIISDRRFPAQIVASGHDPQFFDDLGCLRDALQKDAIRPDQTIFVADFKTGEWVPAANADFFRCSGLATPMNSSIVAMRRGRTTASCVYLPASEVLGK